MKILYTLLIVLLLCPNVYSMSEPPVEVLDNTLTELQEKGAIDSTNSTVATLGGGIAYTGSWVDVTQSASAAFIVLTDADSAASGFRIEFSDDASNINHVHVYTVQSNSPNGGHYTAPILSQYMRVKYTNGTAAQSSFALSTYLFKYPMERAHLHSINHVINDDHEASIVRVANDIFVDYSANRNTDIFTFHRFGYNDTVPNGSWADIWSYGPTDATYNWPVTAETLRIRAGGNAADDAAGVGAQSISIMYYDSTWAEVTETLVTAGAGASAATGSTAVRFIRAYVDDVGAIGVANTGNIIIENTTTNEVVGYIVAGIGQTEQTHHTVPAGYTAYFRYINVQVATGTNKSADIRLWQRENADDWTGPTYTGKRMIHRWVSIQESAPLDIFALPSFPEKTDIWLEGYGNGAVTGINVSYDLILIKD